MARNTLIINVDVGETRVALVENGVVVELYVERAQDRSPVGNIYLGRVTRVLPGMQAAFIDIGLDRAAFLHVEDVITDSDAQRLADEAAESNAEAEAPANGQAAEESGEAGGDGDGDGTNHKHAKSDRRPRTAREKKRLTRQTPIRDVLKEGQTLMVQVSKGPISTKGARVTSHVALPGRYVVFVPAIDTIGISKRIGNDKERKRLKEVIEEMKPPGTGIIVRTLAAGLTKGQLKADIGYLVNTWDEILRRRSEARKVPALLYRDVDIILRAARDLFDENVEKIVIDDRAEHARLKNFLGAFMPERAEHVELYEGSEPFFDEFGVEEEIARALARKVQLPSGGYLIIDQAEALTAIDVNTGRFTGKGRDVEDTILHTNLEAVKEIGYQLRFRNIGGLIVLDFIDMEKSGHREKVYKALLNVLKKDKAKTTAVRISELGLVEMTRKRTRESLNRTLYEPCFYCDGTGHLQSKQTICHEIFRQIKREKDSLAGYKIVINAHPAICDMLEREEKEALVDTATRYQRRIVLQSRRDYHLEQFDLSGA
jgi:ribonuclease G